MGCGCNKKKTNVSTETSVVEKCEVSIQDLENLRLSIIQKSDFTEKEDLLNEILKLKNKYNEECPDADSVKVIKKFILDV